MKHVAIKWILLVLLSFTIVSVGYVLSNDISTDQLDQYKMGTKNQEAHSITSNDYKYYDLSPVDNNKMIADNHQNIVTNRVVSHASNKKMNHSNKLLKLRKSTTFSNVSTFNNDNNRGVMSSPQMENKSKVQTNTFSNGSNLSKLSLDPNMNLLANNLMGNNIQKAPPSGGDLDPMPNPNVPLNNSIYFVSFMILVYFLKIRIF